MTDQHTTVAWIEFAETGNIRFWTGDPDRATIEGQRRFLTRFSLAELVSFAPRRENQTTLTALRTAIGHIEHMAAWIGKQNAGYSFESLGEDMPGLRDAAAPARSRMPAPDEIVLDASGNEIAAMFFYAAAEQDLGAIADEQGFECRAVLAEEDIGEDDPLFKRLESLELSVDEWTPRPREGWTLASKFDGEEGPMALFIRRKDAGALPEGGA